MGHAVAVATTVLWHCSMKADTESGWTDGDTWRGRRGFARVLGTGTLRREFIWKVGERKCFAQIYLIHFFFMCSCSVITANTSEVNFSVWLWLLNIVHFKFSWGAFTNTTSRWSPFFFLTKLFLKLVYSVCIESASTMCQELSVRYSFEFDKDPILGKLIFGWRHMINIYINV